MAATSVSQGAGPTEPGLQVNWLLISGRSTGLWFGEAHIAQIPSEPRRIDVRFAVSPTQVRYLRLYV